MVLAMPLILCGLYWQAWGLRGLRGLCVRHGALVRHSLVTGVTLVALEQVLGTQWSTVAFLVGLVSVSGFLLREALVLARRCWGGRLLAGAAALLLLSNAWILLGPPDPDVQARRGLQLEMLWWLFSTAGFLQSLSHDLRDKLAATAMTDALTGALNRHGLLPQLERELARARRGKPLSVVLCDLDHFKKINDQHGHDVGDDVLRRFVMHARTGLRRSDLVGRWGGEEFLFVLSDTAAADAKRTAQRVQAMIATDAASPAFTFSAGVASTSEPALQYDLQQLLACADRRLYMAKEKRDRVVAEEDEMSLKQSA